MNYGHLKQYASQSAALKYTMKQAAALASVVLGAFSYQAVLAQSALLPQGGTVVNGQVTIRTNASGNQMNVVNTPGAVINWNSFNIGSGAGVNFQQQNANSSVMNRVTGGNISTIHGNLTSNGRVILVNPAGLVIGTGAVVDTAGFVGSAMNATEANNQLDRLRFDAAAAGSGAAGRIQVEGIIRSPSGDIVLIAPDITVGAFALIQAPNGAVTLAAGQRVQLHGRGLDGITLELQAPTNSAINLGRIEGQAVGMFAGQLRHSGIIDARQANIEGGRIVLKAAENLTVTGTITAYGATNTQGQNGKGGNITLEGQRIALQGASISASGPAGGGNINIGGGWQGKDTAIRNASQTFVDQQTSIKANATNSGNGGQVVIWSDGDTWYAGTIEAKGGQQAGNGGKVEVSGKQRLGYHGVVNTSAANGQAGSLLLDPKNIYIATQQVGVPSTSTTLSFLDGGMSDFVIDPAAIAQASGTVTLQATNDIFVRSTVTVATGSNINLILEAGRSVLIESDIILPSDVGSPSGNSLLIIANSPGAVTNRDAGPGRIVMTGGSIVMSANDSVTMAVPPNAGVNPGGDIVLTSVTAGSIRAEAQAGISGVNNANQLTARRVVLSTQVFGIGSSAAPISISPIGTATTVDLSLYAPGLGGSAYIQSGTVNFQNSAGGGDVRLIASDLNPSYSARVSGDLQVVNIVGSILVGEVGGTLNSANIEASNINLRTSGANGVIAITQANGQPLSVSATQSISLRTAANASSESILIGGINSAGAVSVVAGTQLTMEADAIGAGITVQGGNSPANTTQVSAGNTVTMSANGEVSILGATVGDTTTSTNVRLSSVLGNVFVQGFEGQAARVQGNRVELSALSTGSGQGEISVAAAQTGSASVTAGAGGVQLNAANALRVNSSLENANQTSRIEALAGGNVSINAGRVDISGGDQDGEIASVGTTGGGFVDVISSNLNLQSGSGIGAGALIDSSGDVRLRISGATRIDGSFSRNSITGVRAAGNIAMDTGGLEIFAPTDSTINSIYGITASGVVSVTSSANIQVLGSNAAASNNSTALIFGGAGVTLTMANPNDGNIDMRGGNGQQTEARIQSNGDVSLLSARPVGMTGGIGTNSRAIVQAGGSVNINAPSLGIFASTGDGSGAVVVANSNVNVTATNFVAIDGSGALNSFTGIRSAGDVTIESALLQIQAPNGALTSSTYGITATGFVRANLTGVAGGFVEVRGSSFSNSSQSDALLSGGAGVQINATSTSVIGGIGDTTNARVQSNGNIAVQGPVFLSGGATTSFALVSTTGSVNLFQAPSFATTGGGKAYIYAGANSVTLATLYPTSPVATLAQASATVGGLGAILVPQPDVSTTIALPSGLAVGTTGTGVITYTNLTALPTTFTSTVVVNGVTQSFSETVAPNGSTTRLVTVASNLSGGTVSVSIGSVSAVLNNTPLLESNIANNAAGRSFAPLFADITAFLALPSGGIPGTAVSGTYTFTNNGAATTTFTPFVAINGLSTAGPQLTLAPGQSTVSFVSVPVSTTGAVVSVSAGGSTVPESNVANNVAAFNLAAFVADVSSQITTPASAPAGSSLPVSYVFTNNGAYTTTFTPVILVNGVTTTLAPVTLAPSQTTAGTQSVSIAGSTLSISVSAINPSLPDLDSTNNVSNVQVVSVALNPPVVTPPVVTPPAAPPIIAAPGTQQQIQNNLLAQNTVVGTLVPGGSAVNTNNSGSIVGQRPDSREDLQAEGGIPICRP